MGVETFNPRQRLLTIEGSTALFLADIQSAVETIACVDGSEAEHLVASAGEDERNYAPRGRASFLDALLRQIDEFLSDDDGGFHVMRVHLAASERSPALLEFWFNVASPQRPTGGVWFRQLVVGLDEQRVYAALGEALP